MKNVFLLAKMYIAYGIDFTSIHYLFCIFISSVYDLERTKPVTLYLT